jgi:hypothetical protein
MIEGVTQRTSFDAWGGCVLVLVLLIFFSVLENVTHCTTLCIKSGERSRKPQITELRIRSIRIMQNAHLSYLCDDVMMCAVHA